MDEGERRVLAYRPMIKRLYWLTLVVLIATEAITIRLNIHGLMNESLVAAAIRLVLASSLILSIFVRLFLLVRPRIFSTYEILDHYLLIRFKRSVKEIDLRQVMELKFSLLPPRWFGGFKIKTRSGQKLVFLSLLEGSELVFSAIKSSHPALIPDNKYERYLRTCQLVHFSWQRMREKMRCWKPILIKYLLLPLALTVILFEKGGLFASYPKGNRFLAIWAWVFGILTVIAVIVDELEDKIVVQNTRVSEAGDLVRNLNLERRLKVAGQFVFYFFALGLFMAAVTCLNSFN